MDDRSVVDHPRYADLVACLNASGGWRDLADLSDDYVSPLTEHDVAAAARSASPADHLIRRLFETLGEECTASEMILVLQGVGQDAAAELLLPARPLSVRPLEVTNGPCVWVPLGGRLLLQCEAESVPPPVFVWSHNGAALDGQRTASLTLAEFTAAEAGHYRCVVSNSAGDTLDAGEVTVEPAQTPPRQLGRVVAGGEITSGEAADHSGPVTVAVRPHQTLSLTVRWQGWPEPQLRWQVDGADLPENSTNTLTLKPDQLTDASYVCVAANAVGEVQSAPFVVTVDKQPVILSHPEPALSRQVVGRPVTFSCVAACRRPMVAVWRRTSNDRDVPIPPADFTSCTDAAGVCRSTLRLTPGAAEARTVCRVTCEFVVDGDFVKREQSRPAVFHVQLPAHSKLALIIGNSAYQNFDRLLKVSEDVTAFRNTVTKLGFGTLMAMDLTLERCWRVLHYFASLAAPGSYLLVLVAGHGFTHQRQDYLIPVDLPNGCPDPSKCLCLDDVEVLLQRSLPSVVVMCIDFCRNTAGDFSLPPFTPLPASTSVVRPKTRNMLRLHSTQVGQEAFDDGIFMAHLLRILEEDVTVQELSTRVLRMQPSVQPPIAENSVAELWSLHDNCDHRTPLDAVVARTLLCRNINHTVEATWSNYCWLAAAGNSCCELLLTLKLVGVLHDRNGDCFFVKNVTPSKRLLPHLKFRLESGDCSSAVSTWRVLGVETLPPGTELELLVAVMFKTTLVDAVEMRLRLALGPGGLLGEWNAPVTPEAEGKPDNVEPVS